MAAQRVVYVVELNSNSSQPRPLIDFNVSHSVQDLKVAIAKLVHQPTEWRSINPFFIGLEMLDESLALAAYGVQDGDTVYFVRNVAASTAFQDRPQSGQVNIDHVPAAPNNYKDDTTVIGTLFFKTIQGRTLALSQVPISLTIEAVMARLVLEKNLDEPKFLRLIYGGKQLMPDRMLSDYNIGNDSTIDIVFRLPGGAN